MDPSSEQLPLEQPGPATKPDPRSREAADLVLEKFLRAQAAQHALPTSAEAGGRVAADLPVPDSPSASSPAGSILPRLPSHRGWNGRRAPRLYGGWKPGPAERVPTLSACLRALGGVCRILLGRSPETRRLGVEALAAAGDLPAAAALLLRWLQHPCAVVRGEAHATLVARGWQPVLRSSRAVAAVAAQDWGTATALGAAALDPLLRILHDPDAALRIRALDALGELGDLAEPALPRICRTLRDPVAPVGEAAARALVRIGSRAAVGALCDAARGHLDPTGPDRLSAARLPRSAPTPVRAHSQSATEELVRLAACRALVQLGECSLSRLPAVLPHCTRATRRAVIQEAQARGDSVGVQILLPFLADPDGELRATASAALVGLGRTTSLTLRALPYYPGDRADLRELSAAVLGRIGNTAAREVLVGWLYEPYPTMQRAAALALEDSGWTPAEAADCLAFRRAQLDDPDPEVRRIAVAGLEELASEEAVEALRERHARPERDPQVREAIRAALPRMLLTSAARRTLPIPAGPGATRHPSLPLPGEEPTGRG
ncbi:MAG: hypothetical protein FJX77_04460 [Armatimonadetes bacterium]|nr:hypothetical protein [Armatimonadota bacterium]